MQFSKVIALAALFGMAEAIKSKDNSDPLGRNVDKTTW